MWYDTSNKPFLIFTMRDEKQNLWDKSSFESVCTWSVFRRIIYQIFLQKYYKWFSNTISNFLDLKVFFKFY